MKDLYIQKLNESLSSNLDNIENVTSPTDILCPNCLKDNLVQYSSVDLACVKCGYDFIKVDENTVRIK